MDTGHSQARLAEICTMAPVIAEARVSSVADVGQVTRALVSGGLPAVKIAFDGGRGLPFIQAVQEDVPEAILGVSGLLKCTDAEAAVDAGAQFALGSADSSELLKAAREMDLPFMPVARTMEDARRLSREGHRFVCWNRLEADVATRMLEQLAESDPELSLCIAGLSNAEPASSWLALPNVTCLTAGWLTPAHLVDARDWDAITGLAAKAAALPRGF